MYVNMPVPLVVSGIVEGRHFQRRSRDQVLLAARAPSAGAALAAGPIPGAAPHRLVLEVQV